MEIKFTTKIENLPIITRANYSAKLQRLIQLETDHSIKKENYDYKLQQKFDVMEIDVEGVKIQKLMKKGSNLRFVCKEVSFSLKLLQICFKKGYVRCD